MPFVRFGQRRAGSPRNVVADASPPGVHPALDARAAFIVGDILSDGNARARTFGTDSVLATRFWSAVKPAPAEDMRQLGGGLVRTLHRGRVVGNASGAAMHD